MKYAALLLLFGCKTQPPPISYEIKKDTQIVVITCISGAGTMTYNDTIIKNDTIYNK